MRAVVQRVREASVSVEGQEVARIGHGLAVLLGVGVGDSGDDVDYISSKIRDLRVFEDERGKMNRAVGEVGGGLLVVSQFTLYGDCRRGRRPSFDEAAPPTLAEERYLQVVDRLRESGLIVRTGVFRAAMLLQLVNDGPVTMLLDSRRQF